MELQGGNALFLKSEKLRVNLPVVERSELQLGIVAAATSSSPTLPPLPSIPSMRRVRDDAYSTSNRQLAPEDQFSLTRTRRQAFDKRRNFRQSGSVNVGFNEPIFSTGKESVRSLRLTLVKYSGAKGRKKRAGVPLSPFLRSFMRPP